MAGVQDVQEMSVIPSSNGINERCPLQAQCERQCSYRGHEKDCPYYTENASGDYIIQDQEKSRKVSVSDALIHSDEREQDAVSLPIDMIPIDCLVPHPDNPRKNLGDLTELTDSLKANGVLQNLTVVPDESGPADAPRFIVIIGHRRLAAAKLAGLTELPCVIADRMTPSEQVRTMLEENMQRSDLTVYEQAQGFQMMLDMGDTVESVAKDSGFSVTTIRRRLKLLKLDSDKFNASEARGGTLSDYMELDKIESIESAELKNEVLDKIGTPNFKNALKSAMEREKNQKIIDRWIAEASAFAVRVESFDWDSSEFFKNYSVCRDKDASIKRPDDAGETAYYFRVSEKDVTLYRAKDKKSDEEQAAEARRAALNAAAQAREDKLREISERHFELRKDFVASVNPKRGVYEEIMLYAAEIFIDDGISDWRGGGMDAELLAELLGLENEIDVENDNFEEVKKAFMELDSYGKPRSEARLLMCAAYAVMDHRRAGYWEKSWNAIERVDECRYCENPELDKLYGILTILGYEMSDEEMQMQNGTHPLFRSGENNGDNGDSKA